MARKKHVHLAEVKTLPNVIHDPDKEQKVYFSNKHPLTLELGCGKGEYVLALAQQYPQRSFIGIDKKADRLWHAAKKAIALKLDNVKFMRLAIEKISEYFEPHSVAEIWITFPDPFPKRGDANKRLISPFFHQQYQQLLQMNGIAHLKTDNADLFTYAQTVLAGQPVIQHELSLDISSLNPVPEHLCIQTTFEKRYRQLGTAIKYISWRYIEKVHPTN